MHRYTLQTQKSIRLQNAAHCITVMHLKTKDTVMHLKTKHKKNTAQYNITKHEITLHNKITSIYKSTYITRTTKQHVKTQYNVTQ